MTTIGFRDCGPRVKSNLLQNSCSSVQNVLFAHHTWLLVIQVSAKLLPSRRCTSLTIKSRVCSLPLFWFEIIHSLYVVYLVCPHSCLRSLPSKFPSTEKLTFIPQGLMQGLAHKRNPIIQSLNFMSLLSRILSDGVIVLTLPVAKNHFVVLEAFTFNFYCLCLHG